ncbi:MAG: response regulator receiver protein [Pseudomonadales bacterium]|nr:response regulator receiver protein [Pseudomonadales bacterium]
MTVYAIRTDYYRFQQLDLQLTDLFPFVPEDIDFDDVVQFSQRNASLKAWWQAPDTRFIPIEDKPEGEIPDLSLWLYATLVLSPKAHRLLGDLLQPHGEFLPVMVAGETYQIFNCLTFAEEDTQACRQEQIEGIELGLNELVFRDSAEQLVIFKSRLQNAASLFCTERLKQVVETYELSGVVFDTNLIEVFD